MPGGDKTYKVGLDVYTIPETESPSFLKDFPKATEVKSFTLGKDTFDIPLPDVNDFLKEMPTAKELGRKDEAAPVPYPESGMNATMGQFVKPEGTFDNQIPEQPDRKPFDQRIGQPVSGDIAATTPAPIDTKQKDDAIVVRKDAIVNTAKMKLGSKVDENSPAFKNEVKRLTGNHDKDLTVVTKNREGKPILGRNLNGWDSYLLGLRNNKKAQDEADNLMNASDQDAIKMLDAKAQESEYMKGVPNGASGALGEMAGGMTRMIKNQGIGAAVGELIAGAAAPETGGASLALIPLLTGAAATMPEFRKLAYAGELQKRYQQLVGEGKPKDEAYRLAKESAKGAGWLGTGEALAFSIAGQAANKILPAASETLRGANSAIKTTIRSIAPEAVAQAGVSAASAAGKDLYARSVGIDVKNKDIVNDAIEGGSSAVQTLLLMGIMHAVANKVMEIPKYARSQIKNALSTVPKEQMQEVYKEIEANGLAGEGTGDQVIKDVEDFKKAKKPFESLPIEEENKAALAGKALQKQGLVDEKNNLEKHGEAFRGRIDELDKQIAAIEKQMAGMYDAKDVLGKEKDDLTGQRVGGEKETVSRGQQLERLDIQKQDELTNINLGLNERNHILLAAADEPIATVGNTAITGRDSTKIQLTADEQAEVNRQTKAYNRDFLTALEFNEWRKDFSDRVLTRAKEEIDAKYERLAADGQPTAADLQQVNDVHKNLTEQYLQKHKELVGQGLRGEELDNHPDLVAIKGDMDKIEKGVKEMQTKADAAKQSNGDIADVKEAQDWKAKTWMEKQQAIVNELPKKKVYYKDLKKAGNLDSRFNNPQVLDSPIFRSAKSIYDGLMKGEPIRDTPYVNEDMEVMDGINRISAQVAAGVKDIDVAVIDDKFYDYLGKRIEELDSKADGVLKSHKVENKSNTIPDAIPEPSTAPVLQRQPEETGVTGGERPGVEPIVKGAAPATESAPRQEGGTGDGKAGEVDTPKVNTTAATPIEDKQAAKQEIEKRRDEELSKVRTLKSYFEVGNKLTIDGREYTVVKNGEHKFNIETGTGNNRETFVVGQSYNDLDRLKYVANQNGYKANSIDEINAKYDSELANLDKQASATSNTNATAATPIEGKQGAAPATESAPRQEGSTGDGKTAEVSKPVKYEDAIKIEHSINLDNLPEGTDEQSREARSQIIRTRENTPPTFTKHPIGTYAVDRFGEAYQLQSIPIDDLITKHEGTQRSETVSKYAKWQRETGEILPVQGVENYAVHKGKVVVMDGMHRVLAAKENGAKEIPVWVALTDPKNHARPLMEDGIAAHRENAELSRPKPKKARVFKVSTRQDKVNGLIDDVTAHNKLRKNSSERAAVANKIRIAAKELGLKLVKGGSTGDLYLRSPNGKKVQRRFAGSGSAEVFDKTNYSPETHDLVKSHLDQEGGLLGLAVQGSDGRFLDEKQKAAALQDIRDGKDTARAKGVYDSMQSMVDGGHVEFRDNETGEITPVPVAEYLAEIKKEKPLTDTQIEENYPSLWDETADGQEGFFSETEQFAGTAANKNASKTGSDGDNKGTNGEVQGQGTTTGTATGKPVTEEQARQEKHYEEVAGAKPNTQTNRIAVDPIIGGAPKNLAQIVRDVTKGLVQKLFYARPGRRRAIGVYNSGNAGVKIKYNGDIDTTAHELGHSIDDKYGILKDLLTKPDATLSAELKRFSDSGGSKPPKGHPDPAKYLRAEGLAEWLRAFVANPKQAIAEAPNLHKLYEAKVPAADRKIVKQFSDDFRTWAGATGADITMANVEWEPEKTKGFLKKMFETRKSGELEFTWVNRLAANFVNPLHAFEKAWDYARKIKGLGEALPEEDTTILARLFLSVDMKAGEFLQYGLRDGRDQPLKDAKGNVKNLKWLMEPLDNADKKTIKQELKDASAYMIAERTVELADRFDREDIITGVGGGVYKDKDIAQKTLDEFNNGDPKKLARMKAAAERYREFSNDALQYLVDKGRLEQRVEDKDGNLIGGIDFIKKNNLQYVAMRRVMETEPDRQIEVFRSKGGSKLGSITEPITKIKGSTKTIVNPYISVMDTMFKSVREADRNEVMVAFRNVLVGNRTMYDNEIVRLADVGVNGSTQDKNTITIFVNGRPERWLFQEDVYRALKGLDNEGYKLPGLLTLHARILRGTVTKFPVFAIRNFIRDVPDRIIKSVDGSGLRDIVGDKEHWRDVARNGGLNSGLYVKDKAHYYGLLDQAMNDAATKKNTIFADGNVLKKAWHGYENILTKGETVNRVAEFRAAHREAKAKGMDDYNASLYAAFRSRDLMDFAVMGHYMKIINQVVPFSNAAVQGLRSAANSFKSNPVSFISRMALYTIVPQVSLWALNHRNKQLADEYEELPDYQRDMFYNIKIGANKWLAIPKPYELGLLAAGVDRTLSKMFGYNKKAFDGYAGEVIKTLSPLDESALTNSFTPELELMTNHNFFTGKPIIPEYEQPLDLTLRNTEYASRLSEAIQNVAGMDARKTDYWIKAHFSYWGDAALKTSNIGDDKKVGFDITTTGLIKRSPAYNSKSVQDMLEFAARWDMSKTPRFKQFKHLAHSYFDTKDDAQRDVVARQMIAEAKAALAEWEPLQASGQLLSQQKAEAKKADK